MKKILALVLCLCMVMSISAVAMATEPTSPTEPAPTDPTEPAPTDPTEPAPTDPTEPAPTDPTEPAPTDPTEPAPTDPAVDPVDPVLPGPGPSAPSDKEEEEKPVDIPFTDVEEEAYYYDALEWAVEMGITEGTTDTTFSPKAECTRAQMVTFLWRVAGEPAPKSTDHDFGDIDEDAYYFQALLWAIEMGITNGTSDTTFDPAQVCTRGQMAAFLFRYVGTAGDADHPFGDVEADSYYADAIAWAFENGITTGTTDTTFSPADGCTRAQMVTFLFRCFAE